MTENTGRAVGAIAGTAIGVLAYWLMLEQGIHILAAVGAGTALGTSCGARTRSLAWATFTCVLAVASSLLAEAILMPFAADPSFGYFVAHLGDLPRNSLVSLAVVAVLGFHFGRGRRRRLPAISS
ncbi:MAG: hypothetical protein WAT39_15555 [Planctomycetota bacterium]